MKKFLKILFIILILILQNYAQTGETSITPNKKETIVERLVTGTVSYISSQNVYVKFESTVGIEVGDTLFKKEPAKSGDKLIPALVVNHISSTSCAGVALNGIKLEINDILFAKVIVADEEEVAFEEKKSDLVPTVTSSSEPTEDEVATKTLKTLLSKPELKGRFAIQSYSNFSNNGNAYDYQRWRYTFQMNANKIGYSGFSYSQYISFGYRASDWNRVSSNLSEALRVYDLAVKYNFTESTLIWLGRHLNNKISSISSIDGLQFETAVNKWVFGLAAGSRPDFNNMGLNTKLFEYGGYVNRSDAFAEGDMNNTIGYFEQTNDFKTDRRFVYFQHSNSAIENTRMFLSTEVDIFKKELGERKGDFSLTSLYASLNIRPSDMFSMYFSYDARKNVIYYETFKTFADSIFENETRQGFRTRLTVKPFRNLFIGGNYGYRFRSGDIKPSNNYGGYLTYSNIPGIEASSTITVSQLQTSYVKGDIWGITLNKDIIDGISFSTGYRLTNYKFGNGIENLKQHSVSANFYTSLLQPVYLNLTYESIFEDVRTSGRLLMNLTFRF
jgi:hypothetical protein